MLTHKKISLIFNETSTIFTAYGHNNSVEINTNFPGGAIDDKDLTKKLFSHYPHASVYIFLDNLDQTYNLKTFPAVSRSNLNELIAREIRKEYVDTHFKTSFMLGRDPSTKKWNYIFVSSPMRENIKNWLDFLEDIPVVVQGIYFLSLETQNFLKQINKYVLLSSPTSQVDDRPSFTEKLKGLLPQKSGGNTPEKPIEIEWKILIFQKQNACFRQIAFSDGKIIFTKMFSSTSSEPHFLENLERDLYSIREYLRRTSATANIDRISVVVLGDDSTIEALEKLQISGYFFQLYTFNQMKRLLRLEKQLTKTDIFAENILIVDFFRHHHPIHNFDIPRISSIRILYTCKIIMEYITYLGVIAFVILVLFLQQKIYSNTRQYNDIREQNRKLKITLQKQRNHNYEISTADIRLALEVGWFYHLFQPFKREGLNPKNFIDNISRIVDEKVYINNIKWYLVSERYINLPGMQIGVTRRDDSFYYSQINLTLLNPTGDIDTLIRNFEDLSYAIKLIFGDTAELNYMTSLKSLDLYKTYNDFSIAIEFKELPPPNNN